MVFCGEVVVNRVVKRRDPMVVLRSKKPSNLNFSLEIARSFHGVEWFTEPKVGRAVEAV